MLMGRRSDQERDEAFWSACHRIHHLLFLFLTLSLLPRERERERERRRLRPPLLPPPSSSFSLSLRRVLRRVARRSSSWPEAGMALAFLRKTGGGLPACLPACLPPCRAACLPVYVMWCCLCEMNHAVMRVFAARSRPESGKRGRGSATAAGAALCLREDALQPHSLLRPHGRAGAFASVKPRETPPVSIHRHPQRSPTKTFLSNAGPLPTTLG